MKVSVQILTILLSLIALSFAAKYDGTNGSDAGRYLDRSHGVARDGNPLATSTARSNALGWDSNAYTTYSLQDASRAKPLSNVNGFTSRNDQNNAVHAALISPNCVTAINNLKGSQLETCSLNILNYQMQTWNNGKTQRCGTATQITLQLAHYPGQSFNPVADVLIMSAVPT